ncbi:MAG: ATP-binding protein [Bacteroidota bacterium]
MKKLLQIGFFCLVLLLGGGGLLYAQTLQELNAEVGQSSGIKQMELQNKLGRYFLKTSSGRARAYAETTLRLGGELKKEVTLSPPPPFTLKDIMIHEIDAYNILGEAYEGLGDERGAIKAYRKAVQKSNQIGYGEGRGLATQKLKAMGKKPNTFDTKSGELFKDVAKSLGSIFDPETTEKIEELNSAALWVRAAKAENDGNYPRAISDYEKLVDFYQKRNDSAGRNKAYVQLANIYRIQNDPVTSDQYLALAGANPGRKPDPTPPSQKPPQPLPSPEANATPTPPVIRQPLPAGDTDDVIEALEKRASKGEPGLDKTIESLKKDRDRYYRLLQERKQDSSRIAFLLGMKIKEIGELEVEQQEIEGDVERVRKAQNFLIAMLTFISLILGLMMYLFIANRNAHRKLKGAFQELEDTHLQLKNTQTQLVSSEKMASLGQLTAGIAHEINNPINFISGNIHPLRNDVEDLMTLLKAYDEAVGKLEKAEAFAEIQRLKEELEIDYITEEIQELILGIDEGANRTTEIIKGLRNFARMDEEERKSYDVHQGIDSTLALLRNQAGHDIEIVKSYGDIGQIHAYPGKINQVFMNILSNGIQAMPDGGMLNIQTQPVKEGVEIRVRDTGMGMSEEVQKRIFEPFFTTKPVGEGTGLGMSISHGIIEQHEGTIEVSSIVGQGTEIMIYLPKKTAGKKMTEGTSKENVG